MPNDPPIRTRQPKQETYNSVVLEEPVIPDDPNAPRDPEGKLMLFISNEIERMKQYTDLAGSAQEPSFHGVNQALTAYQNVQLGLLASHNLAKMNLTKAKEAFEDWYAGAYLDVREQVNPRALTAQKWYSQKEIEMQVRRDYSAQFHEHNNAVLLADHELNFFRRLLDSWDRYAFVLNNLSKNLISEVNGLGVSSDKLNSDNH